MQGDRPTSKEWDDFSSKIIPFYLLSEHDLAGKPVSTFSDHALK
jgi:hypothetical protein